MTFLKNFFYSPGGEGEAGYTPSKANEDEKDNSPLTPEIKEEDKDSKPVIDKIKEALQDWANKDEQDQEFDDTRV